ncbi:uncharacterized protein LTR77_009883 [Saxophila tyrrhenica]|uniref:Uncharacterized protein n=1 Tax=Saxophila tyrrhenica TaxID=1690608 RepID=A0AAV9P0X0_9PEZI|nr:hypothetical protein LTR77_009883 [Saxophila tyrrhenica]
MPEAALLNVRSWAAYTQMPAALLELLWSRQRNLRSLELTRLCTPQDEIMLLDTFDPHWVRWYPNFTELVVRPNIKDGACAAGHSLKHFVRPRIGDFLTYVLFDHADLRILLTFQNIKELVVYGHLWEEDDIHGRDWNEASPSTRDKLGEGLFPSQPPSFDTLLSNSAFKASNLRTLDLRDVNLRFCRESWFVFQDLKNLTSLALCYCLHPDVFLTALMRDSVPGLEETKLVHSVADGGGDRTLIELAVLLNTCISFYPPPDKANDQKAGLRTLILHLRNLGDDSQSTAHALGSRIGKHGKTLRSLCLDFRYSDRRKNPLPRAVVWHAAALKQLLRDFSQLRELAIAAPPCTWSYQAKRWYAEKKDFKAAINVIVDNTNLTVLNLLDWPLDYHPEAEPYLARLRPAPIGKAYQGPV